MQQMSPSDVVASTNAPLVEDHSMHHAGHGSGGNMMEHMMSMAVSILFHNSLCNLVDFIRLIILLGWFVLKFTFIYRLLFILYISLKNLAKVLFTKKNINIKYIFLKIVKYNLFNPIVSCQLNLLRTWNERPFERK